MFSATSNVYAYGVKIIQVQYPATVTYGSSGTIDIKVHVQAAFPPTATYGNYGVLTVAIVDLDNNSTEISGADVTAASQPDTCGQAATSGPPGTQCAMTATSASVDETFDFTFSNSHMPASSLWHLAADAFALNPCSVCTGGIQTAESEFSFTITVLPP